MEISAPKIDNKVCVTKADSTNGSNKYAKYYSETQVKNTNEGRTALCGDSGHNSSHSGGSSHSATAQHLKDFVKETLKGDGSKNWPTSTEGTDSDRKSAPNDNAVARDLIALNRDEKTIVAGLLAKTIEGGEVVEIRAVSLPTAWLTLGIEIGVL
ncbi:hypothetical protein ANAPC1_00809 [Anaplasma phagocytophilum]|uniref:Uncharacterized protein n=1 Tax=Anaplasma phagocytophilum TaxID=948 RepID=A0AA45UT72_ANAPH|nr:hypothetical protein ANAPC1_00809 [Anaplasma phagocytophilum]SCV65823.1 hypothetical protein ANAPC5_01254 [Anaplasma phagocytophilum]